MVKTEAEAAIDAALDAGDGSEAIRLAIAHYGPELMSFLAAVHGSREDALEVFADASADLVRTIKQFERRSSLRTWLYALARNASHRYFDDSYRRRRASLSEASDLAELVRTATAEFMRTEWKDRLRQLREELDPGDRAVLVLRVDRQLSWAEIAEVMGEAPTAASSARYRKRFERIKEKLRQSAVRSGWLDDG